MIEILTNLLAFLVVLGVLIFFHEFGHFFMAKLLGVRVEVFSFGFGPRLFGLRGGETDYRVSGVPLGGYVRLHGELPEDVPEGAASDPRSLTSKPRWGRFLIFLMGPALNVVLSFAFFSGLFMAGWYIPGDQAPPPVLGEIERGGPADRAGLLPGDRIERMGGETFQTWPALQEAIVMERPGTSLPLEVQRDGQRLDLTLVLGEDPKYKVGRLGAEPLGPPALVEKVIPGGAAEAAGIRPGDLIARIEGKPVGRAQATEIIRANPGKPLRFTLLREGKREEKTVTPSGDTGMIGVGWPTIFTRKGPVAAMGLALVEMKQQSGLLFRTLRGLLTGNLSMRAMSGPIEIAKISGDTARQGGLRGLVFLMGMISLQLGILNLLPIPVLDGGHILILLVEGTVRRDLSIRLKERIQTVGLVLIFALMGTVVFFDLLKLDFVSRLLR